MTNVEIVGTISKVNHRAMFSFRVWYMVNHIRRFLGLSCGISDDYGDIYIELYNNENISGEQEIDATKYHNKINDGDIGDIENKDDEEEMRSISSGCDSSISICPIQEILNVIDSSLSELFTEFSIPQDNDPVLVSMRLSEDDFHELFNI